MLLIRALCFRLMYPVPEPVLFCLVGLFVYQIVVLPEFGPRPCFFHGAPLLCCDNSIVRANAFNMYYYHSQLISVLCTVLYYFRNYLKFSLNRNEKFSCTAFPVGYCIVLYILLEMFCVFYFFALKPRLLIFSNQYMLLYVK